MQLEALLRAHGHLAVERPPLQWEVDGEDAAVRHLLAEMIALAQGRGGPPAGLVLNVSNLVVEPESAGGLAPAGEFVALTVRGTGDWSPEETWAPGARGTTGLPGPLAARLAAAGSRYAYTRVLGAGQGSVTAWLPRLT